MSCGPPRSPCIPPTPIPCSQPGEVPAPLPPCLAKPRMRGLHWRQTMRVLAQAFALSALGGLSYYFLVGRPRREKYREFHERGEFEEWGDEMARKGLFQSVPKEHKKVDKSRLCTGV